MDLRNNLVGETLQESVFQAIGALSATAAPQLATSQAPTNAVAASTSCNVSYNEQHLYLSDVSIQQLSNKPQSDQPEPTHPVSSKDQRLLQILSRYTGRPNPSFTSQNQRDLLCGVLEAEYDSIIAVLPTGSGKSIAIFGPILGESSGVSIVITPFVALRRQLADQAAALGITHLVWSNETSRNVDPLSVRLVIMITDNVSCTEAQT